MNPLIPAISATMVGTFILAIVYFSLYRYDRQRYLLVWAVGWVFYAVRFLFAILLLTAGGSRIFLFANHMATLISGMLLLHGTYLFLGRSTPRAWILAALAGTVWIAATVFIGTSYFLLSLPTFLFLACIYVWTGVVFLRSPLPRGLGKRMAGAAFIIWGIHKGDYPFLRPLQWFAPWGFLIGAVLEFAVAFGVLLVYYQKTKIDLLSGEERYRRLAAELEKEKNVLNRITDTSPSAIVQVDRGGRIVYANPMAEKMLGLTREGITGRTFNAPEWEITDMHGNPLPEEEFPFRVVKASGRPVFDIRHAIRKPGGQRIVLSINASPLFDRGHSFDGMVATIEDITDRIRVAEETRQLYEQLTVVLDNSPLPIVAIDQDRRVTLWNPAAEKLFGWSKEEVTGGPAPFIQEEMQQQFRTLTRDVFEGRQITGLEIRRQRKDGSLINLSISTAPLRSPDGTISGALAIYEDISEKKRTAERLRKSEERFELAVKGSNDGIWDWYDINNDRYWWSDRTYEIFGYRPGEIEARVAFWKESMHPEDRDRVIRNLTDHFEKRTPYDAVFRIRTKSGEYRWVHARGQALWDSEGRPVRMAGSVRDITFQKQTEEELEAHRMHLEKLVEKRTAELNEARDALLNLVEDLNERTADLEDANERLKELDRLKSMFIASMSHELRTPLNSIIGFTGIMLRGMVGEVSEEQKKQLTIVRKNAEHLLSLITDIIDLSKIEAGAVEPRIEEFNLSLLADEVVNSLSLTASEKGLSLVKRIPSGIRIISDERRVRQVLVNILGNAVKFTEKGAVTLTLSEKDGIIETSVSDTGPGMGKEDLDQLFRPFSKTSPDGLRKQEGTGLGLYLSRKITDLLGGEISVRSEPDKGSMFIIRLPREYEARQSEKNPPH